MNEERDYRLKKEPYQLPNRLLFPASENSPKLARCPSLVCMHVSLKIVVVKKSSTVRLLVESIRWFDIQTRNHLPLTSFKLTELTYYLLLLLLS